MKEFLENFDLHEKLEGTDTTIFLTNKIFDEIEAFVFIFDFEKSVPVWINKYYKTMMGYSEDDLRNLTGESFMAMFHPNSLKLFLNRVSNYNKSISTENKVVYQLVTKDHKWVNIMVSTKILKKNSDNKIKYLIGYGIEISGNELQKNSHVLQKLDLKSKNLIDVDKLSKRELEIIINIANCLTDKEIAEKLNISIHTTKTHRKRIINKLGLKNTASLVKFALENGIS
jgi:DNA-binding CsgD family transcriptional regulator